MQENLFGVVASAMESASNVLVQSGDRLVPLKEATDARQAAYLRGVIKDHMAAVKAAKGNSGPTGSQD